MQNLAYPITIFYDGACGMCVGQMEAFRRRDSQQHLRFEDISKPGFDAKAFGLEGEPLQTSIHAKDQGGKVVRGIEAFEWMWWATGRSLLARFIRFPLVKPFSKLVYQLIAKSRYRLSGEKQVVCDEHCQKTIEASAKVAISAFTGARRPRSPYV